MSAAIIYFIDFLSTHFTFIVLTILFKFILNFFVAMANAGAR